MLRAVLLPVLGCAFALAGRSGVLLLVSSALACLVTALVCSREAWKGTLLRLDDRRLWDMAKAGVPLTLSATLLAISSVIDRFVVAYLVGHAPAGQFAVGVDLVRQTLIIPALSAAAAFMPLAVQIWANRGREAVRVHLEECFELLLAITLPTCFGFAIVSAHIANAVLGPEFRELATQVMPIVAVAVFFQILTYQYLHTSFVLSGHNTFYLVTTGSIIVFNTIFSFALVRHIGVIGAAWARLAAEVFGFAITLALTRWAFPVPMPFRKTGTVFAAAIIMACAVRGADAMIGTSDRYALVLLIPLGVAVYLPMCWLLDVANARAHAAQLLIVMRHAIAQMRGRWVG
jgi:O-antigen/teichoic acid export membrane protein